MNIKDIKKSIGKWKLLSKKKEPELMTQKELGAMLKLGRGQLSQKRKHPDFSKPVQALLPTLRWRKADIIKWLERS